MAIDNRILCTDVAWRSFTDDKGRDIVEYKCILNGVHEYFEQRKPTSLKKIKIKYDLMEADRKNKIDRNLKRIQDNKVMAQEVSEAAAKVAEPRDRIDYEVTFSYQCVDGYSIWKEEVTDVLSCLEDLNQEISDENRELEAKEHQIAEERLREEKRTNVEQIAEVFQWAISEDGSSQLVHAGSVVVYDNLEPEDFDINARTAIKSALNDEIVDYKTYARSASVRSIMDLLGN